jgi:hopanoid-associated phosphorylase
VTTIGVVTGMAFEAGWLREALERHPEATEPGIKVAGASPARAEAAGRKLLNDGASALLSFGVAGALHPNLKPGDLVISDRILSAGAPDLVPDGTWRDAVIAAAQMFSPVRVMPILTVSKAVTGATEKASLYRETGAGAVDMESYGVAKAAVAAKVPFLAVRAIGDGPDRSLPRLGAGAVRVDGTVKAGAVLAALLRHPLEIGRLIGAARDTGKARASLRRVAFRELGALLRA